MALGFWTTRREMAGIANSLGEIDKVDHHKQNFRYRGQLHSGRQLRQLKFSDVRSLSKAVSQSFGIMQTVTSAVRCDVNDLSHKHFLIWLHMPLVVVLVRAMSVNWILPRARHVRKKQFQRQAADLFDAPYW